MLVRDDEQIALVVIHDAVDLHALRQAREPVQHRGLVVRRHLVDDVRQRVGHIHGAAAVDGHVVREVLGRIVRRADHGCEIDHRDALAGRQAVYAELGLAHVAGLERGGVGIRDEQPVARLVDFDADRGLELRVGDERHDAAVALDLEDRAFGQRARQEPAIRLVVLDAFRNEAAALRGDDFTRGFRRRRSCGLGRFRRCAPGGEHDASGHEHEEFAAHRKILPKGLVGENAEGAMVPRAARLLAAARTSGRRETLLGQFQNLEPLRQRGALQRHRDTRETTERIGAAARIALREEDAVTAGARRADHAVQHHRLALELHDHVDFAVDFQRADRAARERHEHAFGADVADDGRQLLAAEQQPRVEVRVAPDGDAKREPQILRVSVRKGRLWRGFRDVA